jgi:lipopolysaccharide export system protein LptA
MHADKMTVRKDAAGNQFATLYAAPGGVTKFRQKRDGGKDMWIDGSASDRIEYDTKTEIAKLFKNGKYITLVLTVTNLYFILYGVQNWTT